MDHGDLGCCYISSPTIKRLTVNSQLSLFYCIGIYRVEINAPALRYLKLEDRISECISVGELTSLIEADVCFDRWEEYTDEVLYSRSMFEFVGRPCNVKCLKLSTVNVKALDSAFSAWTIKFHNLIKLELSADWRFISMFLAHADNLQVLTVSKALRDQADKDQGCWMVPQQVPKCLLLHLKTIKNDQFGCAEHEFEIVRYLLKNALVLKRMDIYPRSSGKKAIYLMDLERTVYVDVIGIDLETKYDAIRRNSLFPRGSQACKLAFDD